MQSVISKARRARDTLISHSLLNDNYKYLTKGRWCVWHENRTNRFKAKKVGIVTLFGRFNYGNRLQNYAVAQIWQEFGYWPETLVLAERPNAVRSLKRTAKLILGKREPPSPEMGMSIERLAAFDRFNRSISIRKLDSIENDLLNQYSYFSVGSDQVWNPGMMMYNEDWFFLEFARPEQRIALAPSIGVNTLSSRESRRLAKGVKGFECLSIREERGAELIKQCSGRNAEVICDPTLVLNPNDWRQIADGRFTPKEPYVFAYLLGDLSEDARYVLDEVTNSGKRPVIYLSDRDKAEELPVGPAEFIDLVDHAEHVITDSFHAAVFSCMFETPLTIVRRGGSGGGMFSRLETLAHTLGIEKKLFGDEAFNLYKADDYQSMSDRISLVRDSFMEYLESALDGR